MTGHVDWTERFADRAFALLLITVSRIEWLTHVLSIFVVNILGTLPCEGLERETFASPFIYEPIISELINFACK